MLARLALHAVAQLGTAAAMLWAFPLLVSGQPTDVGSLLSTAGQLVDSSGLGLNSTQCGLTVQYTVYMGDEQLAATEQGSDPQPVPNFQAFVSVISPRVRR